MDRHELRQRRQELRLTQTQVAKNLGVTQSFIAKMERGIRPIPHKAKYSELDSIAVQLDDLFAVLEENPAERAALGSAERGPYNLRSQHA